MNQLLACASSPPVFQETEHGKLRENIINKTKLFAEETGVFFKENGEERTIEVTKKIVASTLKDPDSAKFLNLRMVNYYGGKLVCGNINAKNSYGGYTGYTRFVAGVLGGFITKSNNKNKKMNDAYNGGINSACGYL